MIQEVMVVRLCAKAQRPVRTDILEALDMNDQKIHVGAVCVYHNMIGEAVRSLEGTGIPVAAVSTGFPAGKISISEKIRQIKSSVKAGAKEIDIVVSRDLVIRSNGETSIKK